MFNENFCLFLYKYLYINLFLYRYLGVPEYVQ